MTTATTRKSSLGNKHFCNVYFAVLFALQEALLKLIQRCCRQNCKCVNFMLLFCGGRHRIVLKCVSYAHLFFVLPIKFSRGRYQCAYLMSKNNDSVNPARAFSMHVRYHCASTSLYGLFYCTCVFIACAF